MDIKTRMPGMIIEVKVKEGDEVKAKDVIAVMEAMKMEQPILTPKAGVVKSLKVAEKTKVKAGEIIAVIE